MEEHRMLHLMINYRRIFHTNTYVIYIKCFFRVEYNFQPSILEWKVFFFSFSILWMEFFISKSDVIHQPFKYFIQMFFFSFFNFIEKKKIECEYKIWYFFNLSIMYCFINEMLFLYVSICNCTYTMCCICAENVKWFAKCIFWIKNVKGWARDARHTHSELIDV